MKAIAQGSLARACLGLIAFGAVYYAAVKLGLALRFPATQMAAVWPANAVILCALLRTPPKRWWVYLLAAVPGHLAAQLSASVPLWRIAMEGTRLEVQAPIDGNGSSSRTADSPAKRRA